MEDFSFLDQEGLLKGTLVIRVVSRRDGKPIADKPVRIHGCGFG